MADFNDVFDVGRLSEDQLGALEYVLNSPAYTEVFEPYLKNVKDTLQMRLLNRSRERKEDMPDDFIAGGVVVIDCFLNMFKKLIEETRIERIHAAMDKLTPTQRYAADAAAGKHAPVLGANEQMLVNGPKPYDPAEDF